MAPLFSVSAILGSRFAIAGRWFAPHSNSGVVERTQPQPLEGHSYSSSFSSPPSIAHIRHASLGARSGSSPPPSSPNVSTPILGTLFGLLVAAGISEFHLEYWYSILSILTYFR